jgi:outer membrane protein OmpA-like peptidoglycan-associated protein
MRFLFFFFWAISSAFLSAQNLVVNGSFERQTPPTAGLWQVRPKPCQFASAAQVLNSSAQGWRTFEEQTPDLLEWDSVAGCPIFPKPRRGSRMLGLICYHPFQDGQFAFDYHELAQGTLAKPLEQGKTYRISFWVYTNDSLGSQHLNSVYGRSANIRPTFCGNFGFYFSDAPIQTRENFMLSQVDFPVKPQLNWPGIIASTGEWRKITLAFKADRSDYKYFLFGNFFSDAVTPINMGDEERMQLDEKNQALQFWQKKKRIAYYLFDDFAIVADENAAVEAALLRDKKFTLQSSLIFDTGKAELRPASQHALQQLAEVLLRNPTLKFEISGHTDDVGDDATNQTLSEARAQSVYNALIVKGVTSSQIAWKGYGEHQPLTPNDSEASRQQNRRVECRVLD